MPDAEQIVAKLAELYLPGVLYVAFVGAIISAILSAVHAALHAPASQISHNIVVRIVPGLSERGKLWCRAPDGDGASIVAFFIAVTSEGIHELVETASAFGSAGVFVATLFALFTRFGGPASAYASIGAGMLRVGGRANMRSGLPAPYLLGLLAALRRLCRRRVAARLAAQLNNRQSRNEALAAANLRRAGCGHLSRHLHITCSTPRLTRLQLKACVRNFGVQRCDIYRYNR